MNSTGPTMAGLVRMALDEYQSIVERISDPRVEDWPLMDSPIPTVAMVLVYLYFVMFLGPKVMENRKPFKLNNVLVVYNAAQTLFSLVMFTEHLMSGWLLDYSYMCQPVDYSNNPTAMRMANLCWWYYISKLTEFADTIFFVLRKKDSQITLLHLYHHSLTPIETWVCVKFLAGGHGTFSNLVNNLVHIIMYTYYMMSAMGPSYQKYLWWKQHLTTLQLAQFTLVFFHSAQVFFFDCGYPKLIAAFLLVHSTIFFVLFFDFYQKAYNRELARKALQQNALKPALQNGTATAVAQNGEAKPVQQNGDAKQIQQNGEAKAIQQNGEAKAIQQNGEAKAIQQNGEAKPVQQNGVVKQNGHAVEDKKTK